MTADRGHALTVPLAPDRWCAVPLLASARTPIHLAFGPTQRAALAQLEERLLHARRLGEPVEPLALVQPALLRYRIGWTCADGSEFAFAVDVVQWQDPQVGDWCAMLPMFGVVVRAASRTDLRARAHAALRAALPEDRLAELPPAGGELAPIEVPRTRPPATAAQQHPLLHAMAELITPPRAGRDRALGRSELADRLADRLWQRPLRILLRGEPGVGKSTLVRSAVGRLPHHRRERRAPVPPVFRLRPQDFLIGTRWLGEWQDRCLQLLQQAQDAGAVLVVDNLVDLLHAGAGSPENGVAAFLLPFLASGELALVLEAAPGDIDACRRLLPALLDQLEVVDVPAFSGTAATALLAQIAQLGGPAEALVVEPDVAGTVHRLFHRFQPYAVFPGAAATFLHDLCATARAGDRRLDCAMVRAAFARRTGLPARLLRDDAPLAAADIAAELSARVLDQPDAIAAVADVLMTVKAGLADPRRPFGVLLFCGPTGVGKTELTRAMGDFLFGERAEDERLVRLDMSEYALPGAADHLLGSHDAPARWLQQLRRNPFAVVLFDEIEKADPEVFDVLLTALDEGRVSDRFGRVTWLCSAVLILTSNLGARVGDALGFGGGTGVDHADAARRFFRPEFFNRIDRVVAFRPLSPAAIERLVTKELTALGRRAGLADRGLQLEWTPAVVTQLARSGYDAALGARPLQRAIEERLVAPLARWLLVRDDVRAATIAVEVDGDGAMTFAWRC